MAQDPTRAHEIVNGIIIDDAAGIFSGPSSPSGVINAPAGSIFLQTDGTSYKKVGATANDWQLFPTSTGAGSGSPVALGPLSVARYSVSATTGSITASNFTVPFNRTDFSYASITNSTGEFTIAIAGRFLVVCDITIDEASGNNRTEFGSFAEIDTGSGFSQIPGTQRRFYSRQDSKGADSATISFVIDFAAGNKIRFRSFRSSGSSTGQWLADGCSVSFVNLQGVKGDQGPAGSGSVDSVNGYQGVVVLDADDIGETGTRVWFTPAEQTKLAGIETGATADQIASEVPYSSGVSAIPATNVQDAIDKLEKRVEYIERGVDPIYMQVFS